VAGSGFISRNNNNPSAEATFDSMYQAAIPRGRAVLWNVVRFAVNTRGKSRMLESGLYGSVRGVPSNEHPLYLQTA
jgi:hypothetical protein